MKKNFAIIMIFLFLFLMIGCSDRSPESITINNFREEIYIGDEFVLVAKVYPKESSQEVEWKSNNENIATIDANGKLKGISEGNTEIIITSKVKNSVSKTLRVTVIKPVTSAEQVIINETPTEIEVNQQLTLSAIVYPEGTSQTVLWESNFPSIVFVENGLVTGKEEGEAIITVRVASNPSIYDIVIVKVIKTTNSLLPTDIEISGDDQLFVGSSINLTATVFPENTSQSVIWSTTNSSIATVDQNGKVTTIKSGIVYIIATSELNNNIVGLHKLIVKEVEIPATPDLQGRQIKIMVPSYTMHEYNPFLENYYKEDKTARQMAWRTIENNFNCTFVVVPYPDDVGFGDQRFNWLVNQYNNNTLDIDFFTITLQPTFIKHLADSGVAVDINEYYFNHYAAKTSNAVRQAYSYNNKIYGMPVYGNYGELQVSTGLYYNMHLIERFNLESPAKLFMEGRWNFTGFKDWVIFAQSKIPTDYSVLSGKPFSYYQGMTNASGVKLADTVNLTANLNHPNAVSSLLLIKDIYNNVGWGSNDFDISSTSFNQGKTIMTSGQLFHVKLSGCWPTHLWDPEGNSRFGYVPFPYPDNLNKEDTKIMLQLSTFYMMANNDKYGPNYSQEDVFQAFAKMNSSTINYMKADPLLEENYLLTNKAQAKVDDPYSVEALLFYNQDRTFFDASMLLQLHNNTATVIDNIIINNAEYIALLETENQKYVNKLKELFS